ncbi:peptidase domain-containing ABC transporter [Phormidesmis priestleyi]
MHSQPQPFQDAIDRLSEILTLLLPQTDPLLVTALSQAFEIKEFRLGDRLIDDHSSTMSVICQGRVRLLGYGKLQKEVSILVLEAGDTLGADDLWATTMPYSAISSSYPQGVAASTGQLAQIAAKDLEPWLDKLPNLRDRWQQQAHQRDYLLFFKTLTSLRSLRDTRKGSLSHAQLLAIVPHLVSIQLSAGTRLAEVPQTGRFWLRRGEIYGCNVQSPNLGESWEHPSDDWIAQTEVVLYHLPAKHWKTMAATVPDLFADSTPVAIQKPSHSSPRADKLTLPSNTLPSNTLPFPQPGKQRRSRLGQKYPFVPQQSSADCGIACLVMVGQYWGNRLSLSDLSRRAGVGRSGVSLQALATTAEGVGFQARPVRASLGQLVKQSKPWIAHWQGDHYVVVYQVKRNQFLIADPAVGRQKLSLQEFQTYWSGYALLLEPTEQLKAFETEAPSLKRFWGLLTAYRALIGQIIFASLLIQVFGLVAPLLTQFILDRVIVQRSLITLNVFAIGLLLFGIWRVSLTAVRQYLLDYFSNRLDLMLISGFISHTLLLPLTFFESRQVGDILTRVQENQKVQLFLTRQAIVVWLDALMVFVYLGLMAYYNWQLMLLVLGLLVAIALIVLTATPFMRQVSRDVFRQTAIENSALVEILTGVETIKSAAAERTLRWRWEDRLTDLLNARFRGQKLSNTLQFLSGLVNTLGSTALLWYGATLVIQGSLTVGQFVAFNMLLGSAIAPVLSLAQLWDELQEVVVATERLNDVFVVSPEEDPQRPMLILPPLRGEVRFENVTFRYSAEQERNTLQTVSFEILAGQTVAIVGQSGSGKSTLVNLLQGLYQPTGGRILIDGHDIRHVSPRSLRSQLGVVPQDCFLFSGTILENIALFRPEFTLEQIIEVAKLAEAHAFIQDLPLGYQTKVGERGTTLSGGQKQRIAIARALLGQPRLLILDEATSSLDVSAERRFRENLMRLENCTVCMIAHRLSTVRDADNILVVDRGLLVEHGTHNELMAQQGVYYHLAQQQL